VTFSIVARCAATGRFAIAVASSSPAVGARCAFARAGIGAVATQNVTDPRLGPRGLDLMALGASAAEACAVLAATAPHAAWRQLALVDAAGGTASFSGAKVLGTHRTARAPDAVAAGNLLADPGVPDAMLAAFAGNGGVPGGCLGARMLAAMAAGLAAGGEAGPIHSAALLMVEREAWPIADLRVDWSDRPLDDLAALWALWRPQMADYVSRALAPDQAPAYGVPGEG
jgi:uncharacterized Ntn-hydrolase superfamily protein